jgi:hypothetical protein
VWEQIDERVNRCTSLPIVGLLVLPPGIHGQTFDVVRSSPNYGFAIGRSAFEVPDGYLVFAHQTQPDSTNQDITLEMFDATGLLTWEQFLPQPGLQSLGWGSAPVDRVPWANGFIAAISSNIENEPLPDSVYLTRFDDQGTILWRLPVLQDSVAHATAVVARIGKFYMAGGYNTPPFSDSLAIFLLRSDTLGMVESFFRLARLSPRSLDVDPQGNVYLAGRGRWPAWIDQDPALMKLDSNWVEQWTVEGPEPIGWGSGSGEWYVVKILTNGNILCVGRWFLNLNDGPQGMCMAVYDPSGTLQWYYQGLDGDPTPLVLGWSSFTDLYQDSDSTFITCGAVRQTNWKRALVYRFTVDGDSLWRRDYAHYGSASIYPYEVPWSIEPTSDGGMVLTGETWLSAATPYRDLWLLKLDSMGCLVPGCQYVGINDMVFGLRDALIASPNPGSGRFELALSLPSDIDLHGDMFMQVFDVQGRLVVYRTLGRQREQRFTIDLSGEPAGLYSAHVNDGRRILCGTRLMLE